MDDIEELIRRHDDYQFEVKLGYALTRERRKDRYTVEYFFFLPENLDVNESTYTKKQFYRDMLLYLRFQAPPLTLSELADAQDPRSPLRQIKEKLERWRRDPGDYNATVLEYELKLLACTLKDALRDENRALRRALGPNGHPDEAKVRETAGRAVENARRVAEAFRACRPGFEESGFPTGVRSTYTFMDEYVSLLIEGGAHQMLQSLQRSAFPGALSDPATLIREECAHRRRRGYPSQVEEGKDNEELLFRLSVLKKFSSAALHLSVRTEKEGRGIEEMGLALGAGLAMLFATAIAFYSQKAYGTLSFSFFLAVVVSYMFKDRMKALAQRYFLRYRSDRLMDLSTDIIDPFTKEELGECRELVHFIPERRVDPVVMSLRHRDHITEIENTWRAEKVLHYAKEVTLVRGKPGPGSRKTALTDIARFNLRNFLLKMDEPRTDLFVLRDGRSEAVPAARVYHVNLVIKFTGASGVRYERVRLVLDQDGIKRLEPVRGESFPA